MYYHHSPDFTLLPPRETAGNSYFSFYRHNIEGTLLYSSNLISHVICMSKGMVYSDTSFKSIETETELLPFVSKIVPNVNFEGIFDSITLDGVSHIQY